MLRLAAVACAALAAAVYLVAVQVPAAAAADLRVLEGFMRLPGARYADALVGLFNPAPFAVLTLALVLGAVAAGRPRAAAVAFAAMLGAGVTTQVLKPLLAVQRDFPVDHYMGPVAYPSGHTTSVMSLALALVIVSPARLRPLVAAGGALLTVAVTTSILVVGGHYPSDIVGGLLVATGWAFGASALAQRLRPGSHSGSFVPAFSIRERMNSRSESRLR